MRANHAKLGWTMSVAGILLLVVLGKASLVVVLVPAALVLACGLVWVGHQANRVTHGLE